MREKINNISRICDSLQRLEEVAKRSGPGLLRDVADWFNSDANITGWNKMQIEEMDSEAFRLLKRVLDTLTAFESLISNSYFDSALYEMAAFIDNRLEDCILGLQGAIQILAEAER